MANEVMKINELVGTKIYPTCRYCGQVYDDGYTFTSQEEADEYATRKCKCSEGFDYRWEREKSEQRDEYIEKFERSIAEYIEYARYRGIEISEEARDTILANGIQVIDGHVATVVLGFGATKIKIGAGKRGISFVAQYSDSMKREV